jgi:hypothetical protein
MKRENVQAFGFEVERENQTVNSRLYNVGGEESGKVVTAKHRNTVYLIPLTADIHFKPASNLAHTNPNAERRCCSDRNPSNMPT